MLTITRSEDMLSQPTLTAVKGTHLENSDLVVAKSETPHVTLGPDQKPPQALSNVFDPKPETQEKILQDSKTNPKQTPNFVVKKQKNKNKQRVFSPNSFKSDKSKFTDNSRLKNSDISVNQEFGSHIKRQEVLVPLQKPILK